MFHLRKLKVQQLEVHVRRSKDFVHLLYHSKYLSPKKGSADHGQVLDGIPLSKAEQQQADEKFSGKVTMELLEDKLGPSPSCPEAHGNVLVDEE